MPNNFRITGNYYISKAGHDSNDGLTADTQKKSLVAPSLVGKIWVYGSGVYTGNLNVTLQTNVSVVEYSTQIKGDGKVVFDFLLSGTCVYSAGGVSAINHVNIHFKNALSLTLAGNAIAPRFEMCIFENIPFIYNQSQATTILNNSILVNCTKAGTNVANITNAILSIFINSQWVGLGVITNSYFDSNSTIIFGQNPVASTVTNFRNNNIQSIIILGGVKYAIKDQFAGTPQDAGYAADVFWLTQANLTANGYTGTITGWDAAVATCINRDPRFNDVSKLDFTLKADSPHIGRAVGGVNNIGGTSYAQSFYAGASNPNILLIQPSATIDTSNNSDWRLHAGEVEGTVRMIVKVANTNEVITSLPYIGNKAFNSDATPGTSTNFNVPDSKPITSDYPAYRTTTGAASDTLRVVIANHGYSAGVWLKVDGQYREVTSVTLNELIFGTAVRGIVSSGTAVQVGTLSALTSLNPNRLNYIMRSSTLAVVDASNWDDALTWDNNALADAGDYLEQEWDRQPLIDNLNKVGFGDDNYDANYGNPIQVKYIDVIIYLRNNYKS